MGLCQRYEQECPLTLHQAKAAYGNQQQQQRAAAAASSRVMDAAKHNSGRAAPHQKDGVTDGRKWQTYVAFYYMKTSCMHDDKASILPLES
jgi:hypothetical protein